MINHSHTLMIKSENINKIIITFVPSLLVLVVIAIATIVFEVPAELMTRDIAIIAGIHPLTGFLSSLGAFGWCSSATVCFFSAIVLRSFKPKKIFNFFLFAGILSIYLAFDDFFMFHEQLAPQHLKIKEIYILIALIISVIAYLASFYKLILTTDYLALALALIFLAISVLLDIAQFRWINLDDNLQVFYEDGCKWLGIISWLSYFSCTSYQFFLNSLSKDS
jgi:hypothetical protein